jgi:toxin FitB
MIILDTNVISALMQGEQGPPAVQQWLDLQPEAMLWTTAITVYEIRSGLHRLPAGQRRQKLEQQFDALLSTDLGGRSLPLDSDAANQSARLQAQRAASGLNIDVRDTFIAGIARVHRASLATRNGRHFADCGIKLINPWTD